MGSSRTATGLRAEVMLIVLSLIAAGCATSSPPGDPALLRRQVTETERAFAKTMVDRDHKAFTSFLADETVFFSGPSPLHGKQQVADWWKRYYEKPEAPFSWEPEEVEVLESGTLAISSGPVRDPGGKLVGRFSSIWRQEEPGVWRIVFDKGWEVCEPAKP